MSHRWHRVAAGVALLGFAVVCALAFRGVGVAERTFAAGGAEWQRGLLPERVSEPDLIARAGERLLGIDARADVQRTYERYRLGLGDVIEGTVYPQTQARFRAVESLRALRESLGVEDRARVDVAIGAMLAEGARSSGSQRGVQLVRAAEAFRRALQLDPASSAAKVNLEALLRVERERVSPRGRPSPTSGRQQQNQQDPKGPVAPTEDEGSGF
jgi:hypothetical protein